MESVEIELDGKKIEIPIKLPKEIKDNYIKLEDLENTLDLEEILSSTKELEINNE